MGHDELASGAQHVRRRGRWHGLDTADHVADALIGLYEERGHATYAEVVSQTDHAQQCGELAMAAGASDELVVAAFLHDIGHLLASRDAKPDSDDRHEEVAGRFLARWFEPDVTTPVRLHVPAKRYLCAVDPEYSGQLSAASTWTLELQGGPMSAAEVAAFEATPGHDAAVEVRRWDDLAKESDASPPSLATFRDHIAAVVGRV